MFRLITNTTDCLAKGSQLSSRNPVNYPTIILYYLVPAKLFLHKIWFSVRWPHSTFLSRQIDFWMLRLYSCDIQVTYLDSCQISGWSRDPVGKSGGNLSIGMGCLNDINPQQETLWLTVTTHEQYHILRKFFWPGKLNGVKFATNTTTGFYECGASEIR